MRSLHRHAVTDSCRSGGQVGKGASANLTSSRRALEPPDITPCVRPLERSDGRSQREPPGRLPKKRPPVARPTALVHCGIHLQQKQLARLRRLLCLRHVRGGLSRLFTLFSTERNGFFPLLSVFQYASHLLLSANRRPPTTKFVASRPAVTSPNDYSAREKPHEDSPTRVRCLFVHSRVASSGPCEQTASARTQLRRAKRSVQEGNAQANRCSLESTAEKSALSVMHDRCENF
ncbi:hypothetical protein MRX96_013866 [Rhipicephalus microplus]